MFVMINLVKFSIISIIGQLWGNFYTILAKIEPKSHNFSKQIFARLPKKFNFPDTQTVEIWHTYCKIGLLQSLFLTFLKFSFFALPGGKKAEISPILAHFGLFSALASSV